MKNLSTIVIGLTLSIFLFTSCGGSKTLSEVNGQKRTRIENERCQEEALKQTKLLRGYGIGISFSRQDALDEAKLNAHNDIATQLRNALSRLTNKYRQKYNVAKENTGLQQELKSGDKTMIQQIVDETLIGARPICSDTYMIGDTKYETHVCVELTNESYKQTIYNALSKDETLMIDYSAKQFKQDFDKAIEEERAKRQY